MIVLPMLSREVGSGFGALHGVNALVLMGVADHGRPARRRRRRRRSARTAPRTGSPPEAVALRAAGLAAVARGRGHGRLVLPLGWFWQASLLPDSYDMAAMGYADWGGGPSGQHGGSTATTGRRSPT